MSEGSLRKIFELMLSDLSGQRLETILVPHRSPNNAMQCVRINANVNPWWYRELCKQFQRGRKRKNPRPDPIIKRGTVEMILNNYLAGKRVISKYFGGICAIAEKYHAREKEFRLIRRKISRQNPDNPF